MKNLLQLFVVVFFFNYAHSQPTNFNSRGIGGGGSLFFPSINPNNDNEFYVSCDMSEMFHSNDFGISYDQVSFEKLQVSNISTYEFTNDANIAYSVFNDGNNVFPVKTIDGGASWNPLSNYDLNTYGNVFRLIANINNSNQLLVSSWADILFSDDGGNSFSLVAHAANSGAGVILSGAFWDGTNIYVGTNDGLYYSNNSGLNFNLMTTTGITTGQVIWNFVGAKTGPDTRFVCIAANNAGTYNGIMPWDYGGYAKEVYIMDNANGTWIPKSTGINFANDYIMYAAMSLNDINTIYLGGKDQNSGGPLVFRSTDGGTIWTKKFNTSGNANIVTAWEGSQGDKSWGWSETCFGISVAPYNSAKVLFGNFSNVEASSDSGNTWKQAYVSSADQHPAGSPTPQKQNYHSIGLEPTTCWQVHWSSATKMMACFSDIGGIRSVDGGASWGFNYNGFSVNSLYRIAASPNGTLYGATSSIHDIYQSTRLQNSNLDPIDNSGKIFYSYDQGTTWNLLHDFQHPVFWVTISPTDSTTLYASVIHMGNVPGSQLGGIYVSHDIQNGASSTWTKLSNPPRTEGHPASINVLNDGSVLCTFSGRRDNAGAFTNSSGVFIYDPLLSTWTDVSDQGMYYWTKDLVVDPSDNTQSTWYVGVFSGWGGAANGLGGLYMTNNRGIYWTNLTGSQFDRVTSITFNPQNYHQAFLTTETQGLWMSSDMNTLTPAWSLLHSYPFRQPERVFFNPYNQNEMWVTSFGNGMKVGNLLPTGITDFKNSADKFEVFPNPASSNFNFNTKTNNTQSELTVTDISGRTVFSKIIHSEITKIDCKSWSAGIYNVNYNGETLRIIKQY